MTHYSDTGLSAHAAVFVPESARNACEKFAFNPYVNEFRPRVEQLIPLLRNQTTLEVINDSAYSDESDGERPSIRFFAKQSHQSGSTQASDGENSNQSSRSSTPTTSPGDGPEDLPSFRQTKPVRDVAATIPEEEVAHCAAEVNLLASTGPKSSRTSFSLRKSMRIKKAQANKSTEEFPSLGVPVKTFIPSSVWTKNNEQRKSRFLWASYLNTDPKEKKDFVRARSFLKEQEKAVVKTKEKLEEQSGMTVNADDGSDETKELIKEELMVMNDEPEEMVSATKEMLKSAAKKDKLEEDKERNKEGNKEDDKEVEKIKLMEVKPREVEREEDKSEETVAAEEEKDKGNPKANGDSASASVPPLLDTPIRVPCDDVIVSQNETPKYVAPTKHRSKSLLSKISYLGPSGKTMARCRNVGVLSGLRQSVKPEVPTQETPKLRDKPGASTLSIQDMLTYRLAVESQGVLSVCQAKPVVKLQRVEEPEPTVRRSALSWRTDAVKGQKDKKVDREREHAESKKLKPSENSWAAAQIKRRKTTMENGVSDEEVVRKMKSILNKLTAEKFEDLYKKLTEETGISKTTHVEALMQEVFEKATTQHHFIDMYTHLCVRLNEWSTLNELGGKDGSFKRILLNQCQACFETDLSPPQEFVNASIHDEEAFELQVKYKTKMLGNIKFLGALLKNKMLVPRILIACSEVLLMGYTPETIESLAVLIKATGGTFDDPQWAFHPYFGGIMYHIKKLSKLKSVPPRIRFLLKDVLELRQRGWDAPVTNLDRRSTLDSPIDHASIKVISKLELENGCPKKMSEPKRSQTMPPVKSKSPSSDGDPMHAPKSGGPPAKWIPRFLKEKQASGQPGFASPNSETTQTPLASPISGTEPMSPNEHVPTFPSLEDDYTILARFQRDCNEALRLAAVNNDIDGAVDLLASLPSKDRSIEWVNLVSRIVEVLEVKQREPMWEVLLKLCAIWKNDGINLNEALETFMEDAYPELLFDIPKLPAIVEDELQPLVVRARCQLNLC